MRLLHITMLISAALLLAMAHQSHGMPSNADANPQACVNCHQQQHSDWTKSDHAKAMAIASPDTVLATFENTEVSHYGQKARFYRDKGQYWAEVTYGEKVNIYNIEYVFGHYPLQQYLVATEPGRYHILPFAWDSRTAQQGGQRWYHIYPDEEIMPEDRLHWQQPLQNWNGMCADCHSDGLKRQYNVKQDTFDTTFDNINVGCQSCHGTMTEHSTLMASPDYKPQPTDNGFTGAWIRKPDEDISHWFGPERDNSFMQTCFACHSLRSPLTDGMKADTPFLDQFSPTLLASPLYYADGQIKEEVYVYGSFLQSKMFEAGVNCLDCHDKHTMKLKLSPQDTCLQCHSPSTYDAVTHHGHPEQSEGAQCVNCHMPATNFMVVDARRDHSFKIPKPHLSDQLGTPNACIGCHSDETNQWAAKNIENWHGKPAPASTSEQTFWQLQINGNAPLANHLTLVNDAQQSNIVRATAIEYLSNITPDGSLTLKHFSPWLNDESALIRLAAVRVAQHIPAEQRIVALAPLLKQDNLAIKVAAANQLLSLPIPKELSIDFRLAYEALVSSHEISSWRGEGRLNHGMLAAAEQQFEVAEEKFQSAIFIDPYFTAAYINLADLYRNQGKINEEKRVLLQGLKSLPNDPLLHYSHGLHMIRGKDYKSAISALRQAVKYDRYNVQYAYIFWLAMDSVGQTQQSLQQLKQQLDDYNYDRQLVELGLHFAQKLQDRQSYNWLLKYYPQ